MSKHSGLAIASFFLLTLFIFSLAACKKKKIEKQKTEDEKIIKEYIASHNLNATPTGSGLYYVMTSQGTGIQPTSASSVTVYYKGYLTNGTVFDESPGAGASFSLGSVIKGWQEGIPLFKKGGKGILLIPSSLGYGTTSPGKIPKNSVLIFDVELLNVQ
ncbi:MAG: FKBP-type peptidyl-prolyl cis-trans isomerase [Bacteroidetes bacterium]|jgi:FKBP-type peptidyl-prolyl cis-trans isomerase FkpA|nr:FKBP-type peptidyl-prolyl cis-trans isomerase [Bacteroidota bacterium]